LFNHIHKICLNSIISRCNEKRPLNPVFDVDSVGRYEEKNAALLWPEGMGEWKVIRKGTPRFAGHDQLKVPLWGYEMDDDPRVMDKRH
jgi:hypothetical protein